MNATQTLQDPRDKNTGTPSTSYTITTPKKIPTYIPTPITNKQSTPSNSTHELDLPTEDKFTPDYIEQPSPKTNSNNTKFALIDTEELHKLNETIKQQTQQTMTLTTAINQLTTTLQQVITENKQLRDSLEKHTKTNPTETYTAPNIDENFHNKDFEQTYQENASPVKQMHKPPLKNISLTPQKPIHQTSNMTTANPRSKVLLPQPDKQNTHNRNPPYYTRPSSYHTYHSQHQRYTYKDHYRRLTK